MLPMKALRIALGNLLAANVPTLAPVAANQIALIAAPVTPNEDLVFSDLTLATFTGSAPLAGAAGAQQVGIRPTTQEQVITIIAPIGGWRWECSATPTDPEVIYGYALINDAGDALLAMALLPDPVTISQATDFIDIGAAQMTFVLQPLN